MDDHFFLTDAAGEKTNLFFEDSPFKVVRTGFLYLTVSRDGGETWSAPRLLDLGLAAMIGKGERAPEVVEAVRRNGALYLCAIGGAGALAAKHITACEVIAYRELGCESVKRLVFEDFPLVCAIDSEGNDLFRR